MKKRILSLLMVAAMTFGMVACGASEEAPAEALDNQEAAATETESGDVTTYNVGILQLVQHVALDAATQGFKDALEEAAAADGTVQFVFDEQNAAGDSATCATIANQFVANNVDLILANATAPLQACQAATDTIPVIGTSVTDFATALGIDNWSGTTGINITGTSDCAPLDQQAEMIMELFPEAKKVGLVYCTAEPNSEFQASKVEEVLVAAGIECTAYTFADSNDIASVVTSACSESDVLYVPTDNTAASNTEIIANIAEPAGVPIIAGEEGICKGCGIATLSISYYDLGYQAGKMAFEVLVNGADPATTEVQYAAATTKEYLASRCEALGIEVPADYVAISEEE